MILVPRTSKYKGIRVTGQNRAALQNISRRADCPSPSFLTEVLIKFGSFGRSSTAWQFGGGILPELGSRELPNPNVPTFSGGSQFETMVKGGALGKFFGLLFGGAWDCFSTSQPASSALCTNAPAGIDQGRGHDPKSKHQKESKPPRCTHGMLRAWCLPWFLRILVSIAKVKRN